MRLTSPAFDPDTEIPVRYSCLGPNISPPFDFEDVPDSAQSLIFYVEDRDATPEPWVHWLVLNIPATCTGMAEDRLPDGAIEGLANGGTPGYEGPCPKYFTGTHHYYFCLYALDKQPALPATSKLASVRKAMDGHILARAELAGLCTAAAA